MSLEHGLVMPRFERRDERGTLIELLNEGTWESLIYGRMTPSAVLGHHYHERTTVFFFLLEGSATVTSIHVETGTRGRHELASMQGVLLPVKVAHAIRSSRDSAFVMLKSLRYDPHDPDTVPFPVCEVDA